MTQRSILSRFSWSLGRVQVLSWIMVVVAMLFYVVRALEAGADINFDLLNYHFYNGYAYLYSSAEQNFFPAQLQSWNNPLFHAFVVWLMLHCKPMLVAGLLAALQSLNIPLLYLLVRQGFQPVLKKMPPLLGLITTMSVVIMGATGAMTLSEIGTSFGDNVASIPLLAGILFCGQAFNCFDKKARSFHLCIMAAGFFVGIACGLKLTMMVFIPGMIVGFLWLETTWSNRVWSLVAFGIACFFGWGLLDGMWAWNLWRATGNPIFPQLNDLFRSPWFDPVTITDTRFPARTFFGFLTFPFRTAIGDHPGAEVFFCDARLAATCLLLPAVLFKGLRGWSAAFVAFFFVSMALWMIGFGVQRYAIPLEMLSGLVIGVMLFSTGHRVVSVEMKTMAVITLVFMCGAATVVGDWGHTSWENIGQNGNWFRVAVPAELQESDQMFLMLDGPESPEAYIIPFFPQDSHFVRLGGSFRPSPGTLFYTKRREAIATHKGALYSLSTTLPEATLVFDDFHFNVSGCMILRTLRDNLNVCRLRQ